MDVLFSQAGSGQARAQSRSWDSRHYLLKHLSIPGSFSANHQVPKSQSRKGLTWQPPPHVHSVITDILRGFLHLFPSHRAATTKCQGL